MAIPKKIRFVTFDCYGTLVDWKKGVISAFQKEAAREDAQIKDNAKLFEDFLSVQHELEAGSYELYAEVLRRTALRCAAEQEWELEPPRAGFLPASIEYWPAFSESSRAVARIAKKYKTGLLANVDDKLLGLTRRRLQVPFDLVVTAQQVRSYKPDPAHFTECRRRVGGKTGWVHIGSEYETDIAPCLKLKIPVIWINRGRREPDPKARKPDAIVKNLTEAARLLGA